MARRVIGVVLVGAVVGLLAAGCSDNPPPLNEAKPVETGQPAKAAVELTPGGKPDKSHPEAVALVEAAVKSHTGGNPDLLRRLKSVTQTRAGQLRMGPEVVPQTWVVHAGWPDRFRLKAEFANGRTLVLAWSGQAGWQHTPAVRDKVAMSGQETEDYRLDVSGEWLALVFPLTEPDTVVAPAPDATANGKPAAGVRVWSPHLSDAVVHFDKETRRLALITYEGREGGKKVTKEILVLGSKEFLGVTLPEKWVVKSNGNPLAEWTITGLEHVPALDPKLFQEP